MTRRSAGKLDPELPGMSDEAVVAATGNGWNAWVELINAWPGHTGGHTAVAEWLMTRHGLEGWWAQGVTVGWERLTGRRQTHQRADGTFSASSSRTLRFDFVAFKEALFDESKRTDLLQLSGTTIASKPESKSVRVRYGDTVILFDRYPGSNR